MRFRQVHLDFHTSPKIPGIGSRFDAKAFAAAFKAADVDSVTVFSKCHHGMSYHPTEVGVMHPHLEFDLLRAQIDALHAEGINAPVYLSAAWDEFAAAEHADWRIVAMDGTMPRQRAAPNGAGWAFLDFASPYVDYLGRQVEEAMLAYPDGDGIFIDICFQLESVSEHAKRGMEAEGLDWTVAGDRVKFSALTAERYFETISGIVRRIDPTKPLFFNSGHLQRGMREHYRKFFSHLEIESLPTAGWGYEHFPLSARYFDRLGIEFLGMTGKFHFHWGEVGGFKKPEALLYECAAMLAQGARCSIGDHLHPTGKVDASTMKAIAAAYKWVADREPWVEGSENCAEIAVLSAEAASRPQLVGIPGHGTKPVIDAADDGVVRVLLESKFTFDVVDLESDYSSYRLLILPDIIDVDDVLRAKIEAYVADGGRVLLTGRSGIDAERGFLFDVGATWKGTSEHRSGDYVLPVPELRAGFVDDPLFMYRPAERLMITNGRPLGEVYEPYFDRAPNHFSGHVNTPSRPDPSGYAAGVEQGGFVYFSFPIFSAYIEAGSVAMLEIAERLIARALGRPRMIETSLPRAGRATVRRQAKQHRDVIHLLHATPALRGNLRNSAIQPIQDLTPLHDVAVRLEPRGEVRAIRLVPEGTQLEWQAEPEGVKLVVPVVHGHQIVEVSYIEA